MSIKHLFFISVLSISVAEARVMETDNTAEKVTPSVVTSSSDDSLFATFKKKAVSIWLKWNAPSAGPSTESLALQREKQIQQTAKQSAANSRLPASEQVEAVKKAEVALTPAQTKFAAEMEKFKGIAPIRIQAEGRSPIFSQGSYAHKKSGVAVFDLVRRKEVKYEKRIGKRKKIMSKFVEFKVDQIPKVDVGLEPRLERAEWIVPKFEFRTLAKIETQTFSSPQNWDQAKLLLALGEKPPRAPGPEHVQLSALKPEEVMSVEKVKRVAWTMGSEQSVQIAFVKSLSEEDLRALRVAILLSKNQCQIVTGLLDDLSRADSAEYRAYSNFHLGLCLHEMGLLTESVERLVRVVEMEDPAFAPRAIQALLKKSAEEFDEPIGQTLKKIKNPELIPEDLRDQGNYVIAKSSIQLDYVKQAYRFAEKIGEKSALYSKAQYIMSVSEYVQGQIPESLARQKKLLTQLEGKNMDSDLYGMSALNLARTSFQKKDYNEAIQYFLKIRKDNPLWLQALTEQGWAQLMKSDAEGAIGNMYSVQTPYFKSVYKPESYVVRTIGYLNLCQYGDAYRSLSQLEGQYRPMLQSMDKFLKQNPEAQEYYKTVTQYLKGASDATINGLPAGVLREMARHRDYLKIQEAINRRIDEGQRYQSSKGEIEKEKVQVAQKKKRTLERVATLEGKISTSKKQSHIIKMTPELLAQLSAEEDLADFLEFKIGVFDEAIQGWQRFRTQAQQRLEERRQKFAAEASVVLKKRLQGMAKDLSEVLDNNEFLRYEVFAGSGENIRFQMAGGVDAAKGDGSHRIPANVKPTGQNFNWDFDGEFWEDEVGHYRSSLKNNCAQTNTAEKRS